ncbi:hypothetical protein G3A_22725 [Bacillus sp. 17376]|nr:hypothetical protein G3A_22725 [Bacillus sp. 17376]
MADLVRYQAEWLQLARDRARDLAVQDLEVQDLVDKMTLNKGSCSPCFFKILWGNKN